MTAKIMFGENVRRIRAEEGLTQAKVAEMAGVHKRYYQDVEACRKTPSVLIAARLRMALNCDWTDLMRGL
jgi:transcriptional regulator with XRE-family HTH domain